MNCIFEERHIGELTNSPVQWLYTHFSSRIHLRWFFMNGISIFRHYFLWPWQIHLIKPWHYCHEHENIIYVGKLDDCKEKIKAASTYNDLIFYKLTVKISKSLKLFLSASWYNGLTSVETKQLLFNYTAIIIFESFFPGVSKCFLF